MKTVSALFGAIAIVGAQARTEIRLPGVGGFHANCHVTLSFPGMLCEDVNTCVDPLKKMGAKKIIAGGNRVYLGD
jgi:hypothetical protein